jgi:hypothetical protein
MNTSCVVGMMSEHSEEEEDELELFVGSDG